MATAAANASVVNITRTPFALSTKAGTPDRNARLFLRLKRAYDRFISSRGLAANLNIRQMLTICDVAEVRTILRTSHAGNCGHDYEAKS